MWKISSRIARRGGIYKREHPKCRQNAKGAAPEQVGEILLVVIAVGGGFSGNGVDTVSCSFAAGSLGFGVAGVVGVLGAVCFEVVGGSAGPALSS